MSISNDEGGGAGAETAEVSDGPALNISSEPGRFIPPSCVSLEILERHIPIVFNAVIAVVNKACLVSLRLLEGDQPTVEGFLHRFVTITDNTKFIRFTNFIPLDDATMEKLSLFFLSFCVAFFFLTASVKHRFVGMSKLLSSFLLFYLQISFMLQKPKEN